MLKTMKKNKFALMVLALGGSLAFTAPAYAISDASECNAEVKQVIRDLLKANVDSEALGKIDAAILAAEANCKQENFSGAENQLTKARDMIKTSGQN